MGRLKALMLGKRDGKGLILFETADVRSKSVVHPVTYPPIETRIRPIEFSRLRKWHRMANYIPGYQAQIFKVTKRSLHPCGLR